jgi:carbamoyltransferase
MFDLAIYSGHNASFTIAENGKILEVLDLERLVNIKNIGLAWYNPKINSTLDGYKHVLKYFEEKYGATKYENILCNHSDLKALSLITNSFHDFLKAKNIKSYGHQEGHAYNSFYQSDFEEADIISFDGGGDDGCYNFYKANRKNGIEFIKYDPRVNLGEKYGYLGFHCKSIKQEPIDLQGMIVYPGKLMGLVGYGNVLHDKLDAFRSYYTGHHWSPEMRLEHIESLQISTGMPVGKELVEGQLEKDIIATSQHMFETIFDEVLHDNITDRESNLVLTGGCALNILNNTRVAQTRPTFISPNPDDRGLSLGFMLAHLKPEEPFDSTYIGPEAFDKATLMEYVTKYNATEIKMIDIADRLFMRHKILGVVRGNMEHGARALGNRSIICHPSAPDMKNVLNQKVKNREYYRPFAPVVRLEDVSKYFEWEGETRWMSFCPKVRPEWRGKLDAITHVDGTARVQTITREQNKFLYDLLTILSAQYEIGVLLNTSFNIAGKPILNTYRDAVWMLENTQMDGLILEDYFIMK